MIILIKCAISSGIPKNFNFIIAILKKLTSLLKEFKESETISAIDYK